MRHYSPNALFQGDIRVCRVPINGRYNQTVQYNARNSAAVKLVTKASQWRIIGTRGRRRECRGALNRRIASLAGNSEWQSFVRCTVSDVCVLCLLMLNGL
ncbi:hypothetical protein EVAR_53464_1 [Eumeta japonica]|uniref:Uncharacterized protein n=1 Tax=Eumeta variegata TaxID=151549 RepID=A0A4C1XSZ3_EUMVA|nr:hypothetical protein EVAR_53464_1 [Eumeta japonica]